MFADLYLQIGDAQLLREFALDKVDCYEKQLALVFQDLLFEEGLFVVSGEKWKHQRGLMSNFFRFDQIRARLPEINLQADEFLRSLQSPAEMQKYGLMRLLQKSTGEIMLRTFFGKQLIDVRLSGNPLTIELADITQESMEIGFTNTWSLLKNVFLGVFRARDQPLWLLDTREKRLLQRI